MYVFTYIYIYVYIYIYLFIHLFNYLVYLFIYFYPCTLGLGSVPPVLDKGLVESLFGSLFNKGAVSRTILGPKEGP